MPARAMRDVASHRVYRNMSLSPKTEARLEALARATGIPRGRIVDMCVMLIDPCESCHGSGCPDCGGLGLVPCERE